MLLSRIPGWSLLFLVGWVSVFMSKYVVMGGRHPLEASAIAIVIGIILGNVWKLPNFLAPGVRASEQLLTVGIVLMGASLDFSRILSQGSALLLIIAITMLIGFWGTLLLARASSLSVNLSLLIAVGTTICGGTAVAITAPLLKAKEEETSYAVATIALWGVVAILVYPAVGQWLGVTDYNFGVFAGTAIHSTPQVVGAGFIFSEVAGQTATAVKLVRNCFIAPLALVISFWVARQAKAFAENQSQSAVSAISKAFPWFLFVFFLMSWCNTQGYFTSEGVASFESWGKYLIVVGMVGVGLNTNLGSIRAVGYKPLFIGLAGAIIVGFASACLIGLFLSS